MSCYSTDDFPAGPMEGILVYDGNGTSATHNPGQQNAIYYTAFSYDAFGNYSSGIKLTVGGATAVENTENAQPDAFRLSGNYPNPFNPSTTVSYQLSGISDVELAIYNLSGRRVRTLLRGRQKAGAHTVAWDGRDARGRAVASGVYLYRLQAGGQVQVRRMVLVR